MEKNNKFNLVFANAIVKKLWFLELITDKQKREIESKNKDSFS